MFWVFFHYLGCLTIIYTFIKTSFDLSLSGELRDAVKSGDYMAVKLALNSKEDYNLDQEVCSIPVLKCFVLVPFINPPKPYFYFIFFIC